MAHLISLGGWLRALEICAGAISADFSTSRAGVIAQPDLAEYFAAELNTLPPKVAHQPLFEKLRNGIKILQPALRKSPDTITAADVQMMDNNVRELNTAIRQEN